jgi:hypothetical protein
MSAVISSGVAFSAESYFSLVWCFFVMIPSKNPLTG